MPARVEAQRRWPDAVAPAAVLLVLGTLVATAFARMLDHGPAPVALHAGVVASLLAVAYVPLFAAAAVRAANARRFFRAVFVFGFAALSFALIVFYAAAFCTYMAFSELPTRQLVRGYFRDLPAVLNALPFDPVLINSLLAAVLALAMLLGILLARTAARAEAVWGAAIDRPGGRLCVRAAVYAGLVHLFAVLTVPLNWHVDHLELVSASWHNVRLTAAGLYGYRDPVYDSREQKIRAAYPQRAVGRPRNVILVYVDALRADVTQPYGAARENMPFITSLVRSGQLQQVDWALSACPSTICGLAAILQARAVPRQHVANFSLPQVLSRQGYKNAYILSSNHRDFLELRHYYQPIDFFVDGIDLNPGSPTDDYLVLEGLKRLGAFRGEPIFLMLGLVSTHLTGVRAPQNVVYQPSRIGFTNDDEQYRTVFRNHYDNGVRQADDVLRRAWAWLSDNGYLSDAIVIITSDHGEGLGEKGQYSHGRSLYQPQLRIPVWIGGLELNERFFATQFDLAPTIVDSLGLPVPVSWEGRSLLAREDPDRRWSEHHLPPVGTGVAIVRRDGRRVLKYVHEPRSALEAVFDIVKDPEENENLIDRLSPAELEEFRGRAAAALGRAAPAPQNLAARTL